MLTIALPGLKKKQGPKILLSRFRDSVVRRGLAKTCGFLWPFYDVALFSSVARPTYNRPFVIRIDGIYFDSEQTSGPNEELNGKIFESIDRSCGVIFQSEFNRKLVESFYGDVEKPSVVVPNGVDLDVFMPEGDDHRQQIGVPSDAVVLMTSASWRPHKRLRDIIEVFRRLSEDDSRYHLLILGDVPETELPADLKNIHCPGFIDPVDLPAWYRTADIYIFLSWLDHCPNTVVEAIVSGLPVVCSNQGGTRELVERATAGVVCEVDAEYMFDEVDLYHPPTPDHQQVMHAVSMLASDLPTYRSNIDRQALNIDVTADRYISFMTQCLQQR